jgi:hypothetical protein
MEQWIGTLLVLGMIPGLILIVGVVVCAAIQLKRRPSIPETDTQIVHVPDPASRES